MITDSFADEILAKTAADQRVRRNLPDGGRLFLDRRLPFLCVYRRPPKSNDTVSEKLVSTQSAYLIAPGGKPWRATSTALLRPLVMSHAEHFGGFLILEVWTALDMDQQVRVHEESGEPLAMPPSFRVHVGKSRYPSQAVGRLVRALKKVRLLKQPASVEIDLDSRCGPPHSQPVFSPREASRLGCHLIGLAVSPVYLDADDGHVFPGILRSLRRFLNGAFNQTFFTYSRIHTNIHPRHYHSLGRRSFVKAVREADWQLAAIETSFDLLLQATPTNAEAAWLGFRRGRFGTTPKFQYRPVSVEPSDLKRRLFRIRLDAIEDPTLADLLREKQDELDRRITMLGDVGRRRFLFGSLQVYGEVEDGLLALAKEIFRRIPRRSRTGRGLRRLGAEEFAQLAREEISRYQLQDPSFKPMVHVRDDIFSGMLVSQGNLLLGRKTKTAAHRAEALLHHEIGTHLVTYHNGSCQPFRQLALGLAGYDGLQEGMAVLAEYLVGGLDRVRLRLLAGRVMAVKSMLDGAGFIDTFRMLTRDFRFSQRVAYTVTMRVYRGGGLTKDASYLRGLVEVLKYLGDGGDLEPLLSGKIAADHIPLVEELRFRNILRPPPLRPRYLDLPQVAQGMAYVRSGVSVLQLIQGIQK